MNFFKFKTDNVNSGDSTAKPINELKNDFIPQELFTSDSNTTFSEPNINTEKKDIPVGEKQVNNMTPMGIDEVFKFLQTDFEDLGFNDALTNPDEAYRESRERELIENLKIILVKSEIYYNDLKRMIDLHIRTRERAGLIDLVEELNIKNETLKEHLLKIQEFREELLSDKGISQKIKLSYKHGFIKGLAAITVSTLLKP